MFKRLSTSISLFLAVFIIVSLVADLYYHGRLTYHEDSEKKHWICRCDFRVFWIAARSMRYQIDKNSFPSDVDPKEYRIYDTSEKFYHFRYSPFGALAIVPLGLIPCPRTALYVWYAILNVAMLAALLLLANQLSGDFNISRGKRYLILWSTAIVSMRFYLMDLAIGQIDVLIALLFVFFLIFYLRDRELLAGITLALILQFKPLFAPMLFYLLLTGKKRLVLSTVASFVALLFTPITAVGFGKTMQLLKNWQEILGMSVPSQLLNYKNQSITYFIGKLLLRIDGLKNTVSVKNLFYLLGGASTLTLYIVMARLRKFVRGANEKKYKYVEVSAMIMVSLLFSPITWVAHFISLIIPFAIALLLVLESKKKKALYFALGAFVMLSCVLGTDITNFIPGINRFHGTNIALGTLFLAYALFFSYYSQNERG